MEVRAKLYDFVAQVTNWKPKGMGICTLRLEQDHLQAHDEKGEQVLDLHLTESMGYSRAASTFHTLETGVKVGLALYFGSQGSDEWFDDRSVAFSAAIEAELSRLGCKWPPIHHPSSLSFVGLLGSLLFFSSCCPQKCCCGSVSADSFSSRSSFYPRPGPQISACSQKAGQQSAQDHWQKQGQGANVPRWLPKRKEQ